MKPQVFRFEPRPFPVKPREGRPVLPRTVARFAERRAVQQGAVAQAPRRQLHQELAEDLRRVAVGEPGEKLLSIMCVLLVNVSCSACVCVWLCVYVCMYMHSSHKGVVLCLFETDLWAFSFLVQDQRGQKAGSRHDAMGRTKQMTITLPTP